MGNKHSSKKQNDIEIQENNLNNSINPRETKIPNFKDKNLHIKKINEFQKRITNILLLSDHRFAMSSDSPKIVIYNSDVKKMFEIDIGDIMGAGYIEELSNYYLVVGCSSGTIKFYKLEENKEIFIYKRSDQHQWICKMCNLSNYRLATFCQDTTINIYQYTNEYINIIGTLKGHLGSPMSGLELTNGNLVSGSYYDKTLRFWDINKMELICSYKDIDSTCECNNLVELPNKRLFVGERNGVRIIDFYNQRQLKYKFSFDLSVNSTAIISDGSILLGTQKGYLYRAVVNYKNVVTLKEIKNEKLKNHFFSSSILAIVPKKGTGFLFNIYNILYLGTISN